MTDEVLQEVAETKPKKKPVKKTVKAVETTEEEKTPVADEKPVEDTIPSMAIGEAMYALKTGQQIARRSWTNKHIKYHNHDNMCESLARGIIVDNNGYSCLLSHEDILSNDWYIVEAE